MDEFKYLGTTLTNQNAIQEEIKGRLNSRNSCYHSVQSLLSCSLLSKYFKIKIYRTTSLPVVLYGCETWSVILREERRLRVFENGVLRIFGPRRDGVTREWRKLHNEELNDLHSSPNIVRVIKSRRMGRAKRIARMGRGDKIEKNGMGGACSTYGERRAVYRVSVGKPEGKRPLEKPRRRWEDNIKMDLQKVVCWGMDWNELAQERDRWRALVNGVLNPRVP